MSPVSASFSISGSSIWLFLDFDFFFFEPLDFELFSFDVFLVGEFERDRDRERDLGVVEFGGGETRRWFVERFEFRFEVLWFWITSYDTV